MRNRCCSTAAAAVVSELPAGHNHPPLENAQPTTVDDVTEYIRIYPQHGNGKKKHATTCRSDVVQPRPAHVLPASVNIHPLMKEPGCQKLQLQTHEKVESISVHKSQAAPGILARSVLRRIPANTADIAATRPQERQHQSVQLDD